MVEANVGPPSTMMINTSFPGRDMTGKGRSYQIDQRATPVTMLSSATEPPPSYNEASEELQQENSKQVEPPQSRRRERTPEQRPIAQMPIEPVQTKFNLNVLGNSDLYL